MGIRGKHAGEVPVSVRVKADEHSEMDGPQRDSGTSCTFHGRLVSLFIKFQGRTFYKGEECHNPRSL